MPSGMRRRGRRGFAGRSSRRGRRGWGGKRRRRLGLHGVRRFLSLRHDMRVRVVHVVDGDTIYVQRAETNGAAQGAGSVSSPGEQEEGFAKVRLAGVNAPECEKEKTRVASIGRMSARCVADQEIFGLQAYRILVELSEGRKAIISCEHGSDGLCARDKYGRYLADLEMEGARDLAETLVARGAALPYTLYPHRRLLRYCEAEARAIKAKVGMWSLGTPDKVLGGMSKKTRSWYRNREKRCAEAGRRGRY